MYCIYDIKEENMLLLTLKVWPYFLVFLLLFKICTLFINTVLNIKKKAAVFLLFFFIILLLFFSKQYSDYLEESALNVSINNTEQGKGKNMISYAWAFVLQFSNACRW